MSCRSLWRTEEALNPLELELYEIVGHPMWVLGTKQESSESAASTLISWAISPAPQQCFVQEGQQFRGKVIWWWPNGLGFRASYVITAQKTYSFPPLFVKQLTVYLAFLPHRKNKAQQWSARKGCPESCGLGQYWDHDGEQAKQESSDSGLFSWMENKT